MSLEAAKAAARALAGARRAALVRPEGGAQAAAHLAPLLREYRGAVLAAYWPMGSEMDPRGAMAQHEGPLALPVVVAKAAPLRFRAYVPGAGLVPGGFGTQVPAEGEWLTPRLLLVPLLAFDAEGYRLGYGGGFYDRSLAELRAAGPCLAVGLAYAGQEWDGPLPRGPYDLPLDAVVSEAGLRLFGGM